MFHVVHPSNADMSFLSLFRLTSLKHRSISHICDVSSLTLVFIFSLLVGLSNYVKAGLIDLRILITNPSALLNLQLKLPSRDRQEFLNALFFDDDHFGVRKAHRKRCLARAGEHQILNLSRSE
jgi:hypothetical protein